MLPLGEVVTARLPGLVGVPDGIPGLVGLGKSCHETPVPAADLFQKEERKELLHGVAEDPVEPLGVQQGAAQFPELVKLFHVVGVPAVVVIGDHVRKFQRGVFRGGLGTQTVPDAGGEGLHGIGLSRLLEDPFHVGERYVAPVPVAGLVEKVPNHDPGIGGVAAHHLADHGVEALRRFRFVQHGVVAHGVPVAAVGGIFPRAVIAPVAGLGPQFGSPVFFVFGDGTVVAETDHQGNAVFRGGGNDLFEAFQKAVVLLVPDDELQDHPDRIVADGVHQGHFPVHGLQMFFEVQFLPEGDPVGAVRRQVVGPAQPGHPVVPLPGLCRAPQFSAHTEVSLCFDGVSGIIYVPKP